MKSTFKTFFLALGVTGLLFLGACSGDDTTGPGVGSGQMTADVNGSTWTAVAENFTNILNEDQQSGNHIIIDGEDANGVRIVLSANGDVPGTYILDVSQNKYEAGGTLQTMTNGSQYVGSSVKATVSITAIDKSTKKVSGTFEFSTDDGKYTITGGQFNDLDFIIP